MLVEAWERLRGYDKWTMTVATVLSTELSRVDVGTGNSNSRVNVGWESVCKIRWQDNSQTEHTAVFEAYEESPLYQLCEGDVVNIRYNPAKPSEYYLPQLTRSRLMRTWKLTLTIVVLVLFGIVFLVFFLAH